jgi:hypothetical protein
MHATAVNSRGMTLAGRIITGLVTPFMLFDGGVKVAKIELVVEASKEMNISINVMVGIGAVLVVSAILYAIPKTVVLGAILLTGYLGGAVATNVLLTGQVFPCVFAVAVGVLTWLGPFLCEPRLRALVPLKT